MKHDISSISIFLAAFLIQLFEFASCFLTNSDIQRNFFNSRAIVKDIPLSASRENEATSASSTAPSKLDPQVFSGGYSTKGNLLEALQEAVDMAVQGLPDAAGDNTRTADLCLVHISSLYDGGSYQPATIAVPSILAAAQAYGVDIHHIVGSSCAGIVSSSVLNLTPSTSAAACKPAEIESTPAVAITLAKLPGTQIKTFHVDSEDLPQGRISEIEWKRAVGLLGVGEEKEEIDVSNPLFWIIPSPAFATNLDDFLQGLQLHFPGSQTIGGIASTVSSLSRAKLYRWSKGVQDVCFVDGCVGVSLTGDIRVKSMTALGAKPVGGIYQILKGQDSTIQIIVLDQTATEALKAEEDEEEDEDEDEEEEKPADAKAAMAQFYAKAQVPKPVLAEANFLMRTLSDDDQAFMRRQLLVGLDQGGSTGKTASDLVRLAEGQGHRFTIYQVASAGMKDGSVTLPLGSVNVSPGTRLRFFVREPDFARREIDALWTGYKKRLLNDQFGKSDTPSEFNPSSCFLIPTLDRGNKFFQGKPGYESVVAARTLPGVPCISGFYANGIIGEMDGNVDSKIGIQGSASGYFLFGSKSGRPVYSAAVAAAEKAAREEEAAAEAAAAKAIQADDEKRNARTKSVTDLDYSAPRSEDGELIIKRREVHSGRALTVSTVEWSVAEKTAKPTSALEGFMWDKETEVDRFRERVPLANLLSQCRLSATDPSAPKPRDWVGPVKQAASEGTFVIIPECKRTDPASGSLRKRYDLNKLVKEYTKAGVPALSVNCDPILFGGTIEHVTLARKTSSMVAVENDIAQDGVVVPPILASDLLLYPYQLYKLRLAGADAVNLVAGALAVKDLTYLTKIASSVQLQTLVTATSEVQLERLLTLPAGGLNGVIVSNRDLEDFSFDETGEQASRLLKSDAMKKLKEKHGADLVILVEGRIGIIEHSSSPLSYINSLKEAGAMGAIVGGGLAGGETTQMLQKLQGVQV